MTERKKRGENESKKKKSVGKPSKYDTHVKPYLEEIKGWYRKGLTIEQIAQNLSIATSTIMVHKSKYQELAECLKTSGEMALLNVENALFKAAVGYTHDEETIIYDATGEVKERKVIKKYQTPNIAAAIFIAKNKDPKTWRDRQHVFQTSTTTVRKDYEHLTDEELEKEMEQLETIVPGDNESIYDNDTDEGELH